MISVLNELKKSKTKIKTFKEAGSHRKSIFCKNDTFYRGSRLFTSK